MRVAVRGALAGRIVAVPPCLDGARGAEGWAAVPGADPALRPLIEGAAGASPYLGLLMQKEGAWLAEAAGRAPEEAFDALLAEIGDGEPAVALRVAKRRAALLIGLCDLGGVWALGEVTGALTALADRAVEVALTDALRAEAGRGRRAVLAAEDLSDAAGLVTLAMGKMGAGELNYSSDIDLVCLFDESRYPPARYGEVRGALVRVVQRMVRTLADVTRDGYVFRTDLRLRPDPSVTPVCIAMEAAERYYESLG
ncbi:MAG: glutamine-synthetase adenylyltransferase, partial [Pseudomonadota bacterium]